MVGKLIPESNSLGSQSGEVLAVLHHLCFIPYWTAMSVVPGKLWSSEIWVDMRTCPAHLKTVTLAANLFPIQSSIYDLWSPSWFRSHISKRLPSHICSHAPAVVFRLPLLSVPLLKVAFLASTRAHSFRIVALTLWNRLPGSLGVPSVEIFRRCC